MNPYSVECEACGTVESNLGFEAAFGHALEHTTADGDHKCTITSGGTVALKSELAEGNR